MPKQKDAQLAERNRIIVSELRFGKSRAEVCGKYGISQARLTQIIHETAPAMPDEGARAYLAVHLEQILENLAPIARGKGRPITSGKGEHVINGETGDYAYDDSPTIQANEVINRVVGTWAKLYGAEKPPPKAVETNPELADQLLFFQTQTRENLALKEQLAIVQSRLAAVEGSVPADVVD